MEPHEIVLGKKVRFVFSLVRKRDGDTRTWSQWALRPDLTQEGIVIGLRTLRNGRMEVDTDPEGIDYGAPYFASTGTFCAALVSTNLFRKPALVALEDLLPAE